MAKTDIRHPALTGDPWPVIGVRVRPEDRRLRAASWRPAPLAVPEDVLLPCPGPERAGYLGRTAHPRRAPLNPRRDNRP
ncbi:hypothetical protein [Streptomyces sp. 7N604]|uniref:hypothetical protein n=1 Tax=Streptomyces sp. 7N604 TaxID=3457415 RepID=UPI003FD395F5